VKHALKFDSGEDIITRLIPLADIPKLIAEERFSTRSSSWRSTATNCGGDLGSEPRRSLSEGGFRFLARLALSICETRQQFSLSQRERVGVRENGSHEKAFLEWVSRFSSASHAPACHSWQASHPWPPCWTAHQSPVSTP